MTYVTDQTSSQLRAHMRRLKAMPGWHEPLADRLYKEILELDAQLKAAQAAAIPTPEGYTSDGWIDVDKGLPEPQTPVLLDVGNKYPLRVMWVEPKTLELGIDQDESAGEYDEETDTYYCHSGWYEWNQHDEVNWRVTAKPLRWMPLPATPGDSHA